MSRDFFLAEMQSALITVLLVSAPPLAVAIIIGLSVGLLQALTQIQDQTLPQAVKLVGVIAVIILFGPLLALLVSEMAERSLTSFPHVVR